jgi:hypothetical protein
VPAVRTLTRPLGEGHLAARTEPHRPGGAGSAGRRPPEEDQLLRAESAPGRSAAPGGRHRAPVDLRAVAAAQVDEGRRPPGHDDARVLPRDQRVFDGDVAVGAAPYRVSPGGRSNSCNRNRRRNLAATAPDPRSGHCAGVNARMRACYRDTHRDDRSVHRRRHRSRLLRASMSYPRAGAAGREGRGPPEWVGSDGGRALASARVPGLPRSQRGHHRRRAFSLVRRRTRAVIPDVRVVRDSQYRSRQAATAGQSKPESAEGVVTRGRGPRPARPGRRAPGPDGAPVHRRHAAAPASLRAHPTDLARDAVDDVGVGVAAGVAAPRCAASTCATPRASCLPRHVAAQRRELDQRRRLLVHEAERAS